MRIRTLGRSGLRVSELCLGTMTFGMPGWGCDEAESLRIVQRYLDAGGNFLDTADGYTNGTSETMIGDFLESTKRRDRVVIATKYTFNSVPGDPNAGGNGRKNLRRALEGSLQRLRTDRVDLYWMHAWDGMTPVEEVLSTMDALVREGKVLHFGFSDVPAWYVARARTIAELRGSERPCALQLEYSLVERNIEREHVPAALELGLGVVPWSPLASGMLTGKYKREGTAAKGEGRLSAIQNSGNPGFEKLFTEKNWKIVDELVAVAKQLERPAAQVALNWVANRPGVTSVILGATKIAQLEDNLKSLDFEIPPALAKRLDAAGRPETVHPYHFFEPTMRSMITGGVEVRREPKHYRG